MAAQRSTLLPLAVGALALSAVVVVFQSILEPARDDGCNTSLFPSPFATALAPAHVAAAVVLAACIWWASGPRPGPWIRRGLAAALAYGLASAAVPGLFAPVGLVIVFGGPVLGPLVVLVLVIRTLVTVCARLPREARDREHAETARWLLWAALLLGVPASATYAWLSGVSLFCF
jgi:hypothetical protein